MLNEEFSLCFNSTDVLQPVATQPSRDNCTKSFNCTPSEAETLLRATKAHYVSSPCGISAWMLCTFSGSTAPSASFYSISLSVLENCQHWDWKLGHIVPTPGACQCWCILLLSYHPAINSEQVTWEEHARIASWPSRCKQYPFQCPVWFPKRLLCSCFYSTAMASTEKRSSLHVSSSTWRRLLIAFLTSLLRWLSNYLFSRLQHVVFRGFSPPGHQYDLEYHRTQSWDPSYLYRTSMILRRFLFPLAQRCFSLQMTYFCLSLSLINWISHVSRVT